MGTYRFVALLAHRAPRLPIGIQRYRVRERGGWGEGEKKKRLKLIDTATPFRFINFLSLAAIRER